MAQYRTEWAKNIPHRENRIVDASLILNLNNSNNFLASTAVIIAGGFITILTRSEQFNAALNNIPMVYSDNLILVQLKLLFLAGIFAYAFFKFAWCIRLLNYCTILVGAMPEGDKEKHFPIEAFSRLNVFAGHHFNAGVRAYFFGATLTTWLIHPVAFIIITIITTVVIYRREYYSRSYHALLSDSTSHKKASNK